MLNDSGLNLSTTQIHTLKCSRPGFIEHFMWQKCKSVCCCWQCPCFKVGRNSCCHTGKQDATVIQTGVRVQTLQQSVPKVRHYAFTEVKSLCSSCVDQRAVCGGRKWSLFTEHWKHSTMLLWIDKWSSPVKKEHCCQNLVCRLDTKGKKKTPAKPRTHKSERYPKGERLIVWSCYKMFCQKLISKVHQRCTVNCWV